MSRDPLRYRPRPYPAPEFPPGQVPLFARTPPAIFPAILGLLGTTLGLRGGLQHLGLPPDLGALFAGLVVPLWLFGIIAYASKLIRRPAVVLEDLVVMPARGALGAACVGGMTFAALIAPFAPRLAWGVLILSMIALTILALLLILVLRRQPPENRRINAGWHLVFSGFIVGALAMAGLGRADLAMWVFWPMLPVAAVIWLFGLIHALGHGHPPPLRPIVAIHLAPASYFAAVAADAGHPLLAQGFAVFALAILSLLLLFGSKLVASGFTPLWGAFTFPLAACAGAMFHLSDATSGAQSAIWGAIGLAVLAACLIAVPVIAFRILRLWLTGRLAAVTNAARA